MTRTFSVAAVFTLSVLIGSYFALAQQVPAQQHRMTFFVTSVNIGKGGEQAFLGRFWRVWKPSPRRVTCIAGFERMADFSMSIVSFGSCQTIGAGMPN